MSLITQAQINSNTKAFIRADLDVPIKNGKIENTYRLDGALPTINYILTNGGKVVIGGHIGRPKGDYKKELSTQILRDYFDKNLGAGRYDLLENLRFDPREEAGDHQYATEILNGCNIYVNDSFATSHRSHASITELPKLATPYAGIRLNEEVTNLRKLIIDPARPFVAIVGGAKIESKLPVISKFLEICDYVLLGGKLGLEWKEAIPNNLLIPIDYAYENKDIGEETLSKFSDIIMQSKTVVWAGPMGMYEDESYQKGTIEVANMITISKAFSVVGGGDTVAAITKLGLDNKFNFISTGGSAMLEFLTRGTLPGLEALK